MVPHRDIAGAAGGINGSKMQLVLEDTKTEPPTAVTAFTRLSENHFITPDDRSLVIRSSFHPSETSVSCFRRNRSRTIRC